MIVMGVNLSHDGSVCVIKDGEVIYYQEEERLTHEKHTTGFINSFSEAVSMYHPEAICFVGAFPHDLDPHALISTLMLSKGMVKHFTNVGYYPDVFWMKDHHMAHALMAFRNSEFEDASVVVIDGAGQAFIDEDYLYRESETIFSANSESIATLNKKLIRYLARGDYEDMLKREASLRPYFKATTDPIPTSYDVDIHPANVSVGKLFSQVGMKIFGGHHNAGKVMGLSAYGKDDPTHKKFFNKDHRNVLTPNVEASFQEISDEDLAYRIQHDSYEFASNIIFDAIARNPSNNVVLAGGYFLNCVNNYKYLKKFAGTRFYVEPNSSDAGTSIGAAMWIYERLSEKKAQAVKTMYLGKNANYAFDPADVQRVMKCVPSYAAQLIADGNIVAIYQGSEESGPRALGNRSMLYDPRDPNGRDVVNTIKKREYFRPFAGSVLQEYAHDWFDLAGMKESSHMMYAVQTHDHKREEVPALQHNDGTSRIQTVSRADNENYYKLIKEFYKITGVPMVLNTSFNLAGDTLVSSLEDAVKTCKESGIKYLYLPERKQIIVV